MRKHVFGSADCEKCHSGWAFNAKGEAYPCGCGQEEEAKAILLQSGLDRKFLCRTFETYIPKTQGQKSARALITKWVQDFTPNSTGLWLDGDVGTGKTHLVSATLQALAREKQVWSHFTTVPSILLRLKATYQDDANESEGVVLDYYCTIPLLALDDIGTEKNTEWSMEQVHSILDHRYRTELPVIITTNLSESGLLNHLGTRMVSRLREMTTHVNIDGPDARIAVPA